VVPVYQFPAVAAAAVAKLLDILGQQLAAQIWFRVKEASSAAIVSLVWHATMAASSLSSAY